MNKEKRTKHEEAIFCLKEVDLEVKEYFFEKCFKLAFGK